MGGDIGRRMPEIPWTDDDMGKAAEATRRERKRADIAEQRGAELQARIARLEHGLRDTVDFLRISTDPSPEQRLADKIDELLNEPPTEHQTMVCGICGGDKGFIAAKQVEALRDCHRKYARRWKYGDVAMRPSILLEEADRIEREAEEES